MIEAISGISAAFGLATSAGLNAYIPLLLVALAARFPLNDPLLKLSEPYNVLGTGWAIGILAVLLIIEMTVDKIPAADTLNDVVQTLIRPVAGAILFAANANVITDLHPIIALVAGLLLAGGVHATKTVVRPAVTATTAGTGNWAVSILEDIIAFFMSVIALLVPLLAILCALAFALFIIWLYQRRRQRRKQLIFK
ncbi:MAG: DUF4126 domain-containing protein [Chloroflexi bacterium]|nr:DUF4126 domain-containing protein [Chloroflexota bacterium]